VVRSTPWGASSEWNKRTLLSLFHQDIGGGQQFFDILGRLRQDPARFLPAIEAMSLWFATGTGECGPGRRALSND